MAKQASITLKNLTKEYTSHDGKGNFLAVNSINVTINSGEFVTLLGPYGCGKTTTLRMIAGFEPTSSGEILLNGERINELTPDKRDSAMVFQSYALFPHYTVFDNVAYGLTNKNFSKKDIKDKVETMLDLVGLSNLAKRLPNQLSGGQQQRVALARALVMEPAVLLFDEPLSNLDAKLRVYMRREIRKIQQRLGITSIYVTHDQSEAMSLSDKIIIMNKGQIEQIGTPKEIYQHPASHFVADFIGNANFIPCTILDVVDSNYLNIKTLDTTVKIYQPNHHFIPGDNAEIVIRPESVILTDEDNTSLKGRVLSSTYMGLMQEYTISIGDYEINIEDYNPVSKQVYAVGSSVGIHIPFDALHIVKKEEDTSNEKTI